MLAGDIGGGEGMEKIKLLPCPFCGESPEKIRNGGLKGIHCSNPGCIAFNIQAFYCSWKKAIHAWNRRYDKDGG